MDWQITWSDDIGRYVARAPETGAFELLRLGALAGEIEGEARGLSIGGTALLRRKEGGAIGFVDGIAYGAEHDCDADCTVVDGECVWCGVEHSDPCGTCGGRGFHGDDCEAA